MANIAVERHGQVLEATLSRGKTNAINSALVDELLGLVGEVSVDATIRTLVLASASEKAFCAGFDVEEVFSFAQDDLRRFIARFVDVIEGLRSLPQTVVVAVSGHAYAGGALLALAGDLRLMPDKELDFTIPEANLGVNMPLELTGWLAPIPHGVLREMLLCAAPLRPRRALEIGLAAKLVPSADLRPASLEFAQDLAGKARLASAGIKAGLNAMAGGVMDSARRAEFVDRFAESWFSDESIERRCKLAASLGKG